MVIWGAVVIISIDREKSKISLGMKQLQASPWQSISQNYPPEKIVTGKVTKISPTAANVNDRAEPGEDPGDALGRRRRGSSDVGVFDLDLDDLQSGPQHVDSHTHFEAPTGCQRAGKLERPPRDAALA